MEEEKVQEFINTLYLRHQLCCFSQEEMIAGIKDDEHFIAFIDTAKALVSSESGFMYTSYDFASKIRAVMATRRFSIKDKEAFESINEIIGILNKQDNADTLLQFIYRVGYKLYQEDLRQATFPNDTELFNSIAYDYVTFYALEYDMLELIDKKSYPLALLSIMYLLKECPEIFQDEEVMDNTKRLLEMIKKSKKPFGKEKKRIKTVDELLSSISKKEE